MFDENNKKVGPYIFTNVFTKKSFLPFKNLNVVIKCYCSFFFSNEIHFFFAYNTLIFSSFEIFPRELY